LPSCWIDQANHSALAKSSGALFLDDQPLIPTVHSRLKQFLETYPGSSFPTRSETTGGGICVVKMRGAGNGAGALLSEFVVNRLGARAGWAVPDASIIEIPAGFPWTFGTDEFHDLVQKSAGANLGLQLIEGAAALPAERYQTLPTGLVSLITTIDLVFANVDRTAQSRNLLFDRQGRYWIIDHGSCRFLARDPDLARQTLPAGHIFSDRASTFDRRWLVPLTPALVEETIAEVPADWLDETGLTRREIVRRILGRIKW